MYKKINKVKQLNFQINRVLTYGPLAADEDLIKKELKHVSNLDEWLDKWNKIAKIKEKENNYMQCAYAYRMCEFFLNESNPLKNQMYDRAIQNFYKAFDELGVKYSCNEVPYKNTYMHTIKFEAEESKKTILICGGYDSFIEEFVLAIVDIVKKGYTVIMYEGDGQGKTLQNGLHFIYNWEEPTSRILDYYNISDCILIGISWGGYLALRAAAYDNRISSVVAYDVADNGYEIMTNVFPLIFRNIIRNQFKNNKIDKVNKLVNFIMSKSLIADWAVTQGEYITGTKTPYEFYKQLEKHDLKEVYDKINQNVLLLAGEKDHYIPIEQYDRVKNNLVNVKTLKSRIFTKKEGGEQHCQIGNHMLAINEILNWIESL